MRARRAALRGWTLALTIGIAAATPGVRAQQAGTAAPVGRLGTAQVVGPAAAVDNDPATGVISGRVVDASSGAPIAGAAVRVNRPPQTFLSDPTATPQRPIEEVITNGTGHFVIRNLTKGNYQVLTIAGSYLDGAYGRRQPEGPVRVLTLEVGQRVLNADVLMWRTAAVGGTVLDEAGEPAVAMEVRAFRRRFSGGQMKLESTRSAQTDDRGVFRLGALIPGDYVLGIASTTTAVPTSVSDTYRALIQNPGATPAERAQYTQMMMESGGASPLTSGTPVGDLTLSRQSQSSATPPDPKPGEPLFVYRALFYPSQTPSPQSPVLTLKSGEERTGIELRLELTATWRVSGVVSGPDGPVNSLGVRLLPAGANGFVSELFDVATTTTDGAGRFTLLGVPAGSYTLRIRRVPRPITAASQITTVVNLGGGGGIMYSATPGGSPVPPAASTDPAFWAEETVQVAQRNVTNVAVTLRTGSRLAGQVRFEGALAKPTTDQLARMTVAVRPLQTVVSAALQVPTPGRLDAEGRFSSIHNFPGLYAVTTAAPAGWALKSVTVGGRDVSGWPLEIGTADIDDVEITFTDRPVSLSGTIRSGAGQTPSAATVLLFPANVARFVSTGMPAALRRSIASGDTGAFTASGLIPGDYLAIAFDATKPLDLENPETYSNLARQATRVSVTDAAPAVLSLSLASLR